MKHSDRIHGSPAAVSCRAAGRSMDGREPRYHFRRNAANRRWFLISIARSSPRPGNGVAIVVEGFVDCLRVYQAGYGNVVALMSELLDTIFRLPYPLRDDFRHLVQGERHVSLGAVRSRDQHATPPAEGSAAIQASWGAETCLPPASTAPWIRSRRVAASPLASKTVRGMLCPDRF